MTAVQTVGQLLHQRNPLNIGWSILTNLREAGPVFAELPVNALRERIGYPEELADDFVKVLKALVTSGAVLTNYRPETRGVGAKYFFAAAIGQAPRPVPVKPDETPASPPAAFLRLVQDTTRRIEARPAAAPEASAPAAQPARIGRSEQRLQALCVLLAARDGKWARVTSVDINLALPPELRFGVQTAANGLLKLAENSGLIRQYGVARGVGRELIELQEAGFELAQSSGLKPASEAAVKVTTAKNVKAKAAKPSKSRRGKTERTLERELAILGLAAAQPDGVLEYGSMSDLDCKLPLHLQFGTAQGLKYVLEDLDGTAQILLEAKRGRGISRLTLTPAGRSRLAQPG